ncbi:MAG: restriction endonuclease subunit S [Chitinophagaceae bacterium]|nr:restriction endonuclease subunit S [Chitinophagaceae bacterium]
MNVLIWQNVFFNNIPTYISLINEALANEFPLEPLSNHIKVQGGYSFKANEYRSEGIPIIRISDFQDEKIDLSSVRYYKEEKAFDKFELFPGDIIIAMTGGTIGKLAIVQEGLGKLYLNQRVGKFSIINKNEFEPEYIYWLARGIQDKVKNLGYGGAQPNIGNSQIEALRFSFPSKKIQLKIIEFLNDIKENKLKSKIYFNEVVENKIKKYQSAGVNLFTVLEECDNQQTHLQLLRQAILQEAVQGKLTKQNKDDEPAAKLLQRIKTEKQKLIAAGKLKKEKELPPITEDEIPFELPMGWVWCRLGEIGNIMDGAIIDGPFGTSIDVKRDYITEGIPVIRMMNIKPYRFLTNELKFVSENKFEELKRYNIQPADIVFSKVGAGIGEACIVPETIKIAMISTTGVTRFRVGQIVDPLYLCHFLNSYKPEFIRLASTTAQPFLNMATIKRVLFPLPPLSEQHRIITKVQQLLQIVNQLEQQVAHSQAQTGQLLQAVLKEAFSNTGKVYEENEMMTMAAEE